jgi:membrane carboxypeptidase/penicillin-binding protein PbpC
MSTNHDTLTSLLTQLEDLSNSDLRLLAPTPAQRRYRAAQDHADSPTAQIFYAQQRRTAEEEDMYWEAVEQKQLRRNKAHQDRREAAERQQLRAQQAHHAFRAWESNFISSNSELQRMNKVTHHSRKCVMDLQSSGSEGSAAWFVPVWWDLSEQDKYEFKSNVERRLSLRPGDFHVDVNTRPGSTVIFYILSVLSPLVEITFSRNMTSSPWQQALGILHDPSAQKGASQEAFVLNAYDR